MCLTFIFYNKRYEEAIQNLKKADTANNDSKKFSNHAHVKIHFRLGEMYYRRRKFESAAAHFKQVDSSPLL
jgi:tetratricopeptide (TPR) repeat protein